MVRTGQLAASIGTRGRSACALVVGCVLAVAAASPAAAAIVYEGSAAPPATLGGHALAAWPAETGADYTTTSTVTASSATATFDRPLEIRTVGSTWYTSPWSGGYSGKIYWTRGTGDPVTITLSEPADAFGFQAQANLYGTYQLQAVAQDGTTSEPVSVSTGFGDPQAHFFGFHGTGGDKIVSVILSAPAVGNDMALGNFFGPAAPVDSTAPVITPTVTGTEGSGGWYTSDVDLSWSVTDGESAISSQTGCEPVSVTSDQQSQSYTCQATSSGGSSSQSVSIKRDATDPAVGVTGVSDGATYPLGSAPAAGCSTDDVTSGVADEATLSSTGGPVGTITATCSGASDNAGNAAGAVSATYTVEYVFSGFFRPIDNGGVLNALKAGSAVPVKFSLGGDQGLAILAAGSPSSRVISCSTSAPTDVVETTSTAGSSSLSYDAASDQYSYVWKTSKAWAGSCRELAVELVDGTSHTARFAFTR